MCVCVAADALCVVFIDVVHTGFKGRGGRGEIFAKIGGDKGGGAGLGKTKWTRDRR